MSRMLLSNNEEEQAGTLITSLSGSGESKFTGACDEVSTSSWGALAPISSFKTKDTHPESQTVTSSLRGKH